MLASLAASAPWAPSQKQADARAGSTPASGGAAARANSSCGGDAVDAPPQAQQPRAAALVQGGADASLASIGRSSAVALTAAAVVGSVPFEALVDVVGEVLLAQLVHLKLLFAGACSAVVSRTAMAPLERVKMDQLLCSAPHGASTLQAARRIYDNEGVRGFWKGNALNVLRTAPFKALNFASFDLYSQLFARLAGPDSSWGRFSAGACAGITATLVCFPLDVLRTRMMAPGGHKYGGPFKTLHGIMKFEGVSALYSGCIPAVIGMAPAGAVFYGVYDILKSQHLKRMAAEQQLQQEADGSGVAVALAAPELPATYTLLYGAMAGACAELIVYPLEVVRRKMQLQSMAAAAAAAQAAAASAAAPCAAAAAGGGPAAAGSPAAMGRIMAACAAIVKEQGAKGFYSGLAPNMLQVLPSAALSYYTYEKVKQLLGARARPAVGGPSSSSTPEAEPSASAASASQGAGAAAGK